MSEVKASEVQRAYAQNVIAQCAAKGINNPVVVLPAVDDEGNLLPDSAHETGTKGFGYIQLYQVRTVVLKGVEFDNEQWCLHRGKAENLNAKYKAGQVLSGHIVIEDSLLPVNPLDPQQGLKYRNKGAVALQMPACIHGERIYTNKYWDPTGTVQDTIIASDNDEAVMTAVAQANNAQAGIAQRKAQRIAELQAKATKTPREKAELKELMEA